MSTTGMKGRASAISTEMEARYAAMNMHFCGAGCGTPIWIGKDCCDRCRQEGDWLQAWSVERELRRQERTEKLERLWKRGLEFWLVAWDWAKRDALNWALLGFVAWAVAYIVIQYSDMWVQWILGA